MRGSRERQGPKDITWALNPAMTEAKASLFYHEPISSLYSSQFHLGFDHLPCKEIRSIYLFIYCFTSSTYLLSPFIESMKYKVRTENTCSSLASFVLQEDTWPLGRADSQYFLSGKISTISEPCHCLALLLTYVCSLELTFPSLRTVFPDCGWNPEPFLFAKEFQT